MSERFGPIEGGGHLQMPPEIMTIASRQLPHLFPAAVARRSRRGGHTDCDTKIRAWLRMCAYT